MNSRPSPVILVALLAVLAAGFAVLGLAMSPNSADLQVTNGAGETFSSHQFSLQLTLSVAQSGHAAAQSESRLVSYHAPSTMVVYQTMPTHQRLGALHPNGITKALNQYMAIVGGSTPWVARAASFVRTESYRDFATRQKQQAPFAGTVAEVAFVRSGYLVSVDLTITIPNQTSKTGQAVSGVTEHEVLHLVLINGKPSPPIVS